MCLYVIYYATSWKFTYELLSLQAKIIKPPPSPLSLHCHFIAIGICVEPSQIHDPIYSFHMLECPGSKIFQATTGGRKLGHRPPVVALTQSLKRINTVYSCWSVFTVRFIQLSLEFINMELHWLNIFN